LNLEDTIHVAPHFRAELNAQLELPTNECGTGAEMEDTNIVSS